MTMSMPRPRRILLLAIVAMLGLLAFVSFRGETIDVLRVTQGELRQAVVASGRVRTPQRIEIAAQITGRVIAVETSEGKPLVADQVLLRLDDSELAAALRQAQATLAQSEARLRQLGELGLPTAEQSLRQAEANAVQARKQLERAKELVAKGFYSVAQLDDSRRLLEIAESQQRSAQLQVGSQQTSGSEAQLAQSNVAQARAAVSVAQARLAYATLRAPVAGTVLTRAVEVGDTAQPGKPLLTLAPLGDTELTAQIDEKNLGLLALGQSALAAADAYPRERFTAVIDYIAPSVDAQRGSVEIRLKVPQAPSYLRHEMTVSIDIAAAQRANALIVAADAVREANGPQPWVLVVRDGRTQRQPVRLGLRGVGKVEVLEGLVAGEALVPAISPVLADRSVRVRDAQP
jgi:HlyD family secretion protein